MVVNKKRFNKEEALIELANRYFLSHGPATLADFSWWSGLSLNESKTALNAIKSTLISEKINDQIYWFYNSQITKPLHDSLFLLPAYDEFIISYKDRSPSLPYHQKNKAVSNNGVFYPIVILNGQVIGTWKKSIKKDNATLEIVLFDTSLPKIKDKVLASLTHYEYFINKSILLSNF